MAVKKSKPAASEQGKVESSFSKEQLLAAERFQGRKDMYHRTRDARYFQKGGRYRSN